MSRLVIGGFAAALLALAGAVGAAAPVPKEDKGDEVPDLKEFFTALGKVANDDKWPARADERKLTDTVQQVFDRTIKAAELKGRSLPVGFGQLKQIGPVKQKYSENALRGSFVIADNVDINGATGCVIFATGKVEINGATDCVIVGGNVNVNSSLNCFLVAGEQLTVNGAREPTETAAGSVLVAGRWLRVTGANGAVCHVVRPGADPAPIDKLKIPIYIGRADDVIFLNTAKQWQTTVNKNCTTIVPKTPIAK